MECLIHLEPHFASLFPWPGGCAVCATNLPLSGRDMLFAKLAENSLCSPRKGSDSVEQRADLPEQFFELEWLVQEFELVQPCNLVWVLGH